MSRFETGSEAQRQFYRESESWEALMDHLTDQLTSELAAVAPPVVEEERWPCS